ncbi:Potassium voltage-gated channel protein Shaw [Operophtera brumata]|uniref:Potassium voltage-gated channel protein Shaw n=1 Tax=Operophtera brumata TaxID=104452 RepID=A0A0L7L6H9_OPEBR|nr:Potassium voltage-gated channel protein Shaw [Operophtera brumata]
MQCNAALQCSAMPQCNAIHAVQCRSAMQSNAAVQCHTRSAMPQCNAVQCRSAMQCNAMKGYFLGMTKELDIDSEKPSEEEIARIFGYEEAYLTGDIGIWQRLKPRVWALFDEPSSSQPAKV